MDSLGRPCEKKRQELCGSLFSLTWPGFRSQPQEGQKKRSDGLHGPKKRLCEQVFFEKIDPAKVLDVNASELGKEGVVHSREF